MRTLAFILLLWPLILRGMIIESPTFAEIKQHIEKGQPEKLLVVCDIDNTLFIATQHLGSVAWGEHLIAQLVSKGISRREAAEIESILWKTVQPFVKVQNIDPETASILEDIQKQGFLVLGLTARSPCEADYTINQLLSVGIHLKNTNSQLTFECLNHEEKTPAYQKGILFGTPFNKKSHVLFSFLDENKIYPEGIIFVDDKLRHVEDLSKACSERNISFLGIRFSGADEKVKAFNHRIADLQWSAFPSLLSDKEAEEKLSSSPK